MNSINFQMWGKALRTIPRISKQEWNALDIISKWLIATRSAVFIMTAIAAAIGGIPGLVSGQFLPGKFFCGTYRTDVYPCFQ